MNEEPGLFNATVCLLIKNDEVLLAKKSRKIGAGCWNGYGGGIEENESILDSATRELKEESGLNADKEDLEKVAIIDFKNIKKDNSIFNCRVHFFLIRKWQGEPRETDEMLSPTFFKIDKLPLDEMMPADKIFMPLLLNGKKLIAKFTHTHFPTESLETNMLKEVEEFIE